MNVRNELKELVGTVVFTQHSLIKLLFSLNIIENSVNFVEKMLLSSFTKQD